MVTHDIEEAIYLADKIIVMSSRPGKIKEIINIDIGKSRDRSSYDFATIKKQVYNHFFDTEDISVEYTIYHKPARWIHCKSVVMCNHTTL